MYVYVWPQARTSAYSHVPIHLARTRTYQNVRGRTGTYRRERDTYRAYGHVPARTGTARTGTYTHVQARTGTYRNVPGFPSMYRHVRVRNGERARVSFMFGNVPVCRPVACLFLFVSFA